MLKKGGGAYFQEDTVCTCVQCMYMSIGRKVQHQGVDTEGEVPPPMRRAKLMIICGLRMSKTSDLDSFSVNSERIFYMTLYCGTDFNCMI